ncbi:MAG: hypothetical protein KIT31_12670, partial [Deltaproteobacteria bacterium]|nr:hypothetical protein [Deltaproteobacteria bacterium]
LALPIAAAAALGLGIAVAVTAGSPSSPATASASAAPPPAAVAPAPSGGGDAGALVRTIDRATRDKLVERIARARAARPLAIGGAPATATTTPATTATTGDRTVVYDFSGDVLTTPLPPQPAPADPRVLSKSVLRYAIRTVQPLLLDCYRAGATRLPEPVAGESDTIEVRLHVVAEPGVATIVDTAEIGGNAAAARDAEVAECMRETLLSIEMPAMREPISVDMHYPFVLRGR